MKRRSLLEKVGWPARAAVMLAGALLLAGCPDDAVPPVGAGPVADSADQVLYGIATTLAPDGIRRNRLLADTAFVYQSGGLYDMRVLTVTFYDAVGKETSTLTADSGTYQFNTGAMESRGNVIVRTVDGRVLRTSVLRYDPVNNELSSEQPFTWTTPDGQIQGNAFRSDPDFTNIVTEQPRGGQTGRGSGAEPGVLLPGQQP